MSLSRKNQLKVDRHAADGRLNFVFVYLNTNITAVKRVLVFSKHSEVLWLQKCPLGWG